jgi:hypothetical protein
LRFSPGSPALPQACREAGVSFPATQQGGNMDFIEKIFGISPDGGSGAFEVLLFLIPIAGIIAIRLWRKRNATASSRVSSRRDPS